ncbi:MAG TPA: AMP-binding protein, partial [Anaerolineales bacterium]
MLQNQQPDRAISYADLIHGSAAYAQDLKKAGIQPGEVVILILQHGEHLVYGFFGAVMHGAIPAI